MFKPVHPYRNSDTRNWPGVPIPANVLRTFGLSSSIVPANAVAVIMNITGVGAPAGAFLTVWGSGPVPKTSVLNFTGGATANGVYAGPISDLKFNLRASQPMHIICDVTGYWTLQDIGGLNL